MHALILAVLFAQDVTPLPPKESVPLPAAQAKAEKLIKDLYSEDYARHSPADMLALAGKLLAQAKETKDDHAARFVALREARDLAAKAGDILTLKEAIGEIDKLYKVNATDMRIVALELAGRSATTREGTQAVVTAFFALAEELLANDDYSDVHKALRAAENVALKARSAALAKTIQVQIRSTYELEDQYGQVKKAQKKLDKNGDDPGANLLVGKYMCFIKGDWEIGLAMLARCSDAKLKDLAKHDSEVPEDVKGQVEVGDGWYELAQTEKNVRAKKQLQSRACVWYKEAQVNADGINKAKIQKRLAELNLAPELQADTAFIVDLKESDSKVGHGTLGKGELGWQDKPGDDKRIMVKRTHIKKGLSTHSVSNGYSFVRYDLDKKYKVFWSGCAIADIAVRGSDSPLVFVVVGDGKTIWKSQPVQKIGDVKNCKVNIIGVKTIELRVYCNGTDGWACSVWIDPQVK